MTALQLRRWSGHAAVEAVQDESSSGEGAFKTGRSGSGGRLQWAWFESNTSYLSDWIGLFLVAGICSLGFDGWRRLVSLSLDLAADLLAKNAQFVTENEYGGEGGIRTQIGYSKHVTC